MRYLLLASVGLLLSCSATKKAAKGADGKDGKGAVALEYTTWELSSIPGFEIESNLSKKVTIHFTDSTKRVGGNAGCNGYGGTYEISGSKLKFGQMMATKMACMPGMKTENKYLAVLGEIDSYEIAGDKLMLKKGATVLVELKKGTKTQK